MTSPLTTESATEWATQWVEAWNRRDVEAVLAHFDDTVEFSSPLVTQFTGAADGIVRGRAALRDYWTTALGEHPDLHFELLDVQLGAGCLLVHYRNQAGRSASELEVFGPDGRIVRGYALYGC
jgi:ketosteroid isomerase-like protein